LQEKNISRKHPLDNVEAHLPDNVEAHLPE
jgi:hypothetical protein